MANDPLASARGAISRARADVAFDLRVEDNPDLVRVAGDQAATVGGEVLALLVEADELLKAAGSR